MQKEIDSFVTGFLPEVKQGQQEFDEWLNKYNSKKSMADKSSQELVGEWKRVKSSLAALQSEEESLRAALIMRYQDKPSELSGLKVELVKRKGSISYSSIPQLKELDLEQYRGDYIEYWKISEVENE